MTDFYNIAIASDHNGVELKQSLIKHLEKKGHKLIDLGPSTDETVDYPDYVNKMKEALKDEIAEYGILICGTGIGMSVAANRSSRIRAALCFNDFMTERARQHNDANVLVLGARNTSKKEAKHFADIFFTTSFEGGRHLRRLNKIS